VSNKNLPRSRRGRIALAGALALSGLMGFTAGMVSARPFRVLGLDGRSLGYSVARNTGGISALSGDTCREHRRYWTCDVSSNGSSSLRYRVRPDSRGCWTARLTYNGGEGHADAPRHASGCIGILDYLRLWQR
jgi:hypothetical protein